MARTVAESLLMALNIAYIIADRDLAATEVGGAVAAFFQEGEAILAHSLPDLIPELVGNENELADVLAGRLPHFRLEQINRGNRYFTLILRLWNRPAGTLLLTLAETSEQARFTQALMQQRNELYLARRNLAKTHAQLDFLLRHYVPAPVTDALLEQRTLPQLGGELRPVSVLFAGLRGYVPIAEQLPPDQTMDMINHYLGLASEAINEAGGTITQFMGDIVMALFNAPRDQADHAWRAVQAGLAIQRRMATRRAHAAADWPVLHFGVGIQSGLAIVGNTGAQWRYGYSAIGDTTNVAFRFCSAAQSQEVLIGLKTHELVRGRVAATPLPPMRVKGKSRPLPVFRVEA